MCAYCEVKFMLLETLKSKWIILTCLCQFLCVDFSQCHLSDFCGGVKSVAPFATMLSLLHIANKLFHQTHQLCLSEGGAGKLVTQV